LTAQGLSNKLLKLRNLLPVTRWRSVYSRATNKSPFVSETFSENVFQSTAAFSIV